MSDRVFSPKERQMVKNTDEDLVNKDSLFPPTENEKQAIDDFLAHLERAGNSTISRYSAISPHLRDEATRGMLEYWKKAVSVLRWGRSINARRKVVPYGDSLE
jgi:hypothetical protein